MPFHTVCPFCPTKFKFPDNSLGASIRCPKCGNNFTAAPQDEEALACVGFYRANYRQFSSIAELQSAAPPTRTDDQPRDEPAEPVIKCAALVVAPAAPVRFIAAPRSPRKERSIGEWGLVALLVAGIGVLAICLAALAPQSALLRYLAISFAAIGVLICACGFWSSAGGRRFNDFVSLGLGAVVSVLVLVAVILRAPTASNQQEVLRQLLEEADPARFLLVTADNRQMIKDLGRSEWADAEKQALRQDEVHVRVLWAKIDSPPLKKTAPPATLPKCLLIMVHITNLSPQQAKEYMGLANASPAPLLTDRRNHSYALCKFPLEAGVVDLVERAASPTGQRVQELLIFEAPDHEVDLKLQFSAAAWGGRGACRFQIPRTMFGSLPR